jgi:hypothetical protein
MAHYPDLSPYMYGESESATVNIGWLNSASDYRRGDTASAFLKRLKLFCHNPPGRYGTQGFHACEFCGRFLGGSEIRIIASDKVYAAPVLVFHYVEAHKYHPPQEFIDAVLAAPLPDSDEMIQRYGSSLPHSFPKQDEDERHKWNGRPFTT